MQRSFRRRTWWLAVLTVVAFLFVWALMRPTGPPEPVHGGKRLSVWMRGHPSQYTPVVRAIGTNALPFLLAELQATDSAPSFFMQRMLAKISMGPFWQTSSDRAYHARLALQILDTNAAPTLLGMALATPMRVVDGDPALVAALALGWLPSSSAQQYVEQRLGETLQNPDPMKRRNALLTFSFCPYPSSDSFVLIVDLTHDTNAPVRAAAMRALIMCRSKTNLWDQPLISGLNDEEAVVRRLAVEGLGMRGTNAMAAVPALQAAYVAEPTRRGPRSTLDSGFALGLSSPQIRAAIRDALGKIDPLAPLPP